MRVDHNKVHEAVLAIKVPETYNELERKAYEQARTDFLIATEVAARGSLYADETPEEIYDRYVKLAQSNKAWTLSPKMIAKHTRWTKEIAKEHLEKDVQSGKLSAKRYVTCKTCGIQDKRTQSAEKLEAKEWTCYADASTDGEIITMYINPSLLEKK